MQQGQGGVAQPGHLLGKKGAVHYLIHKGDVIRVAACRIVTTGQAEEQMSTHNPEGPEAVTKPQPKQQMSEAETLLKCLGGQQEQNTVPEDDGGQETAVQEVARLDHQGEAHMPMPELAGQHSRLGR